MTKRKLWGLVGVVVAGSVLGALLAPETAWAYIEGSISGRLVTPNGSGCITLSSALQHHDGDDPMSMNASAVTSGLTAQDAASGANGKLCVPLTSPQVGKAIRGSIRMSLLKLVSAGTNGRPDNYFYCRVEPPVGISEFGSSITARKVYSEPPCGPGFYAELACIETADTLVTVLPFFAVTGNFTTQDTRRDCNVSRNWHAVMGDGHGAGTIVKL